jgi:hypothetical protein
MVPAPYSPSRHAVAEATFRKVLKEADLEDPDEVGYRFDPDEVEFLWYQTKVAVVLELEGELDLTSGFGARPGAISQESQDA